MTFSLFINCVEIVIFVMPTQNKHSPSYTKCRINQLTCL